jgi:hypothetical protein
VDVKQIGGEDFDYIYLVRNEYQWRALVKIIRPSVSIKDRELLDQICNLYFRKDSVPCHLLVIEGINKNNYLLL